MNQYKEHKYTPPGVSADEEEALTKEIYASLQEVVDEQKSYASKEADDYDDTWSNYSNIETFIKFLGQTSYYLGLQKNLCKIVSIIKPTSILEFGFGTGHTAVRIADENPNSTVEALDLREKMVVIAQGLASKMDVSNVCFSQGDMLKRVKSSLARYDFIYLLYNFHHIPDKGNDLNELKTEFLRDCHYHMKTGAYLCIAELFIPSLGDKVQISRLFDNRVKEGHQSTFWSSLNSLDDEDVNYAKECAYFSERKERDVGIKVSNRQHEYLVTKHWLKTQLERLGFYTVLDEDVNVVGDAIMLFKKI